MNSNGSLQEVDYEGVKFFLFDNFQNFSKEIERSKKAILKTNFDSIKEQVHQLFQLVAKCFGVDSKELRAVTESKIYCAKCGVAFSPTLLMMLIVPYKNLRDIPNKCPKCNSSEILYLYLA